MGGARVSAGQWEREQEELLSTYTQARSPRRRTPSPLPPPDLTTGAGWQPTGYTSSAGVTVQWIGSISIYCCLKTPDRT